VTETTPVWEVRVLYDGECPLCAREIALLRRLDRGRGRIDFEDIAAPEFDARRYGTTQAALMARIHAALPGGGLVEGVEVFRLAYAAVGLGWLVAPTRWPLVRPLADAAYRWFARNRLRMTGRGAACADDRCAVHAEGCAPLIGSGFGRGFASHPVSTRRYTAYRAACR
jgi:predicted DCC family thiol-disulfide oxidoreductase YuxK